MFNSIFPKIHKEGYKFLAISIIATFIILLFSNFLGLIFVLLTIWVYYFFRDPDRTSINDDNYLVSPADGLITNVSEQTGPIELQLENTTFTKVSIFMNVFNCHVNRTPLSGTVEEINYKPGKFLNASLDKASEENERNYFKIKCNKSGEEIIITQLFSRASNLFLKFLIFLSPSQQCGILLESDIENPFNCSFLYPIPGDSIKKS